MALSLLEQQAITDIADIFYEFLPGSGNSAWRGHVTFRTVATKIGVGDFCPAGSKRPMINALLRQTFEGRKDRFEALVLEIVREGIAYRKKRDAVIRRDEIELLNRYLLVLKFKFPGLWDPAFLASLDQGASRGAEPRSADGGEAAAIAARAQTLSRLQHEFYALHQEPSREIAGLKLERLLNALFRLDGLTPRESFKVVGEQIDGAFDLSDEIYLLEAKWHKSPIPEADLLVFRGKIEAKSAFTRGVFLAMNGISEEAKMAILLGKQPTFFVIDGYDLSMVLAGQIGLSAFLRQRMRLLAQEGAVVVPYADLWRGSRSG